jgi:pyruvate-formate lyase
MLKGTQREKSSTRGAADAPRKRKAPTEEKAVTAEPQAKDAWRRFKPGLWQRDINVRWFIQQNYTPYEGIGAFLAPATERTRRIWKKLQDLFVEER